MGPQCAASVLPSNRSPTLFSIRLDFAGALSPHGGITLGQLESLAPQLTALRDEMLADTGERMSFLALPQQQLTAYEEVREASELGRIFKVANGIHDCIDAVVVLARSSSLLAAKAFFQACCDPYHNELSRADRGSKPRMYFAGFDFDNDNTTALLNRLTRVHSDATPAEKRWAIIVIDEGPGASGISGASETEVALRHFIDALQRQLADEAPELLRNLVIPQLGPDSPLHPIVCGAGIAEVFQQSPCGSEFDGVLSPTGLLPAAMLALDCMKLLAGAVAATEHFASLRFKDNAMLRYVALHHLLKESLGQDRWAMNICNPSLAGFFTWYQALVADKLGRHLGAAVAGEPGIVTDVVVNTCRQDRLPLDPGEQATITASIQKFKVTIPTFLDMMFASVNRSRHERVSHGQPTIEISLPQIDTHDLGQLIQYWLITTELGRRLH